MIKKIENLDTRIVCKRHRAKISARTCVARQKINASGRAFIIGTAVDPDCVTCQTGIFVAEALNITIKRPKKKEEICC